MKSFNITIIVPIGFMLVAKQTNAKDTTRGLRTQHNKRFNKHKQKNNNNDVDIIAKEDVAFFTQISRGLQSFPPTPRPPTPPTPSPNPPPTRRPTPSPVPLIVKSGEVDEVQQAYGNIAPQDADNIVQNGYGNIVPNRSNGSRSSGKSGKGSGKSGKASSGKSGKGSSKSGKGSSRGSGDYSRRQY